MLNNQPVNSTVFHRLTSEIGRLNDEQVEALRRATFVGMTEEEVRQYECRGKQLGELVNEFKVLMSKGPM
jgi:hypothetical protein